MQKRGEASSTWIRLGGQLAVCLTVLTTGGAGPAMAIDLSVGPTRQNAPSGHVAELRDYLGKLRIADPIWYRPLAVYPLLPVAGVDLAGAWLTLDAAIAQGNLVVREKGEGGSVPVVLVENHSRNQHVFILAGEVLGGGKQTRTVRRDVILAPGQRVELEVFCVEAHRWSGEVRFSPASTLVPQSLQKELRRGTDQQRIWSEVARNNRALAAENPTGSLELALKARPVREKLVAVRRHILPEIPHAAVGFIFVKGSRALGGELFGDSQLARGLLPKLLDSYAVDCVLQSDSSGATAAGDRSRRRRAVLSAHL